MLLPVIDLARLAYAPAYEQQVAWHERVLASRTESGELVGALLLVEHDPVITVSRRPTARQNLVATPELLARHGVQVAETDRGGDITYHGPGQLVVYPILDIERLKLGVHDHVRLMERAAIATINHFGVHLGVEAQQDSKATGVWINPIDPASTSNPPQRLHDTHHPQGIHPRAGKVAAMGVRVRKWITMHGLSLNVDPDLSHFDLIVPCGLAGRPVTSLAKELGKAAPTMGQVKERLVAELSRLILEPG